MLAGLFRLTIYGIMIWCFRLFLFAPYYGGGPENTPAFLWGTAIVFWIVTIISIAFLEEALGGN